MRGWRGWVASVVGVVAIELLLVYLVMATSIQENCENSDRLACSETVAAVAAFGFVIVPVAAIVVALAQLYLRR